MISIMFLFSEYTLIYLLYTDYLYLDRLEKILKVELQQTSGKALDEGQLVRKISRNKILVFVMKAAENCDHHL